MSLRDSSLRLARQVIALEIEELQRLHDQLDESFVVAIQRIQACLENRGKIIVCGVGKSGNICKKIAATLNSTGSTAVNLNVMDALHGDLGVVDERDVALMLSYSGETTELLQLLPHIKRFGVVVIAMTGKKDSTLAKEADVSLNVYVEREACPLQLAPTSSTTVMLVLGDAIAMTLLEERGFKADDFARLHPGGSLGRVLLTKVSDVMRSGEQLAKVHEFTPVDVALKLMTKARAGAALVVDANDVLLGIFTHGDFVRAFQRDHQIAKTAVVELMTRQPIVIQSDRMASEALAVLEKYRIDDIAVVNDKGQAVGLIDSQDLSRQKIF
jgi:arabinose-5-phosphate isomerase